jgi:hypothetical protein
VEDGGVHLESRRGGEGGISLTRPQRLDLDGIVAERKADAY